MHCITPLISGIRGAENGTASLYQRGTSTRATWYSSFEGDDPDSSGTDIALDANGGATVFVNELVTVVVKTSAGATLRTFTSGISASAVEYAGQSFSGTNYESGAGGTGSGYPTNLQVILDRWLTSAGTAADDFEVLGHAGTVVKLQNAFGPLKGLVYNVKDPTYGAVGNGTTDDTAAIAAAIAAADDSGGVVFFPAGTYRVTSAITVPINVNLAGAGPHSSILRIDHASANLLVFANTGTHYQSVAELRLDAAQANSGILVNVTGAAKLIINNCTVGNGTNTNGADLIYAGTGSVLLIGNTLFLPSGNATCVEIEGTKCTIWGSTFTAPAATYNPGAMVDLESGIISLVGCIFNNAATGGTYDCFELGSGDHASIVGCVFGASGGATVTAMDLGTLNFGNNNFFYESDNIFQGSITAYSYTVTASNYGATPMGVCYLGSREGRVLYATISASPYTIPFDQYGIIVLTSSVAGNVTLNCNMAPPGARGQVFITNADGSNRDFTPAAPLHITTAKTINAAANNSMNLVALVDDTGANTNRIINYWAA